MKLKPEIRSMEILNTFFRLGVVFAIYGFIWAFIELGIKLLRSGQPESTVEHYMIKGIKYMLLCVVAFLLTLENGTDVDFYSFGMSGLVVILYFLGKLDKAQQRQVFIQFMTNRSVAPTKTYSLWGEISVITLAIAGYIFLFFYPDYAFNGISLWFKESILSIEKTPIFGWVFKLIGFFFLVSILLKVVNTFFLLISGKMLIQTRAGFRKKDADDRFDDFEELN